MYHKVKVGNLSNPQISRLLNGHGVRVSDGSNHEIELSKEQLKKFMKAREKGKAITLTMDPFQMQNHQFLRGSGSGGSSGAGNLTRTSKRSAKRIITSATDRLIRALEGSGNIKATAKDSGKKLIVAGTDRAIRAIEGSGSGGSVNRLKKGTRWATFANKTIRDGIDTAGKAARVYNDSTNPMAQLGFGIGGSVNRLKKGTRWATFANKTIRDGIDTAGKAARVYNDSTNPMAQLGFGLKKRKPKKSMKGSALLPAGY